MHFIHKKYMHTGNRQKKKWLELHGPRVDMDYIWMQIRDAANTKTEGSIHHSVWSLKETILFATINNSHTK